MIVILPMGSFVVNVMVTLSFAFAKDGFGLLLYMVKFTRDGSIVSITTLFSIILSCVTLSMFPALSYAVILNSKGPFVESFRTVTFAYPVTTVTCHLQG